MIVIRFASGMSLLISVTKNISIKSVVNIASQIITYAATIHLGLSKILDENLQ